MTTLYDYLDSGNGYKIRLLLAHLKQPYKRIDVDILAGKTRTPEFLQKNPNGRIPTLELDDGTYLAESDAILWYLAEGTQYIPDDRLGRAQVLQWMFFEQYSHEPYIATPRFIVRHLPKDHPRQSEVPDRLAKGRDAIAVMESHLGKNDYFVQNKYSIADIALYAYTHVVPQAGLDLTPYPRVLEWMARIAARPNHIPITYVPAG